MLKLFSCHVQIIIPCVAEQSPIFNPLHVKNTVQDDLLAREIFGEFVSEIQLADLILAILL